MRRFVVSMVVVLGAALVGPVSNVGASPAPAPVRVAPRTIDFGTKTVGRTYYDQVKVTNTGGVPLEVLVESGLPDDFGFGFMPGSTCPVLVPGAVMMPRESCVAVVRFSPSAGFVGWHQTGSLTVRTTDPVSGATTVTLVPVSGTGKL